MSARVRSLVLVALPAIAALVGLCIRGSATDAFAPYVSPSGPQRAVGDFDGDGRADTALIQHHAGTSRILIQLSDSSVPIDLEAAVTGVVPQDIDHDGDLDLVASTPSGGLSIWLNDGHGRFTRKEESRTQRLSAELLFVQAFSHPIWAVSIRTPSLPVPGRRSLSLINIWTLSSSDHPSAGDNGVVLPSLRAPPQSRV